MENNFCIVIPIYKDTLDCTEELSLKRLFDLIDNKKYNVFFIKPKSLKCKNYYNIIDKKQIKEISFDDKYFKDIRGYSNLCLQYEFYDKFSKFEYLYIYQLDCYLFEDKLNDWCALGFDYIGAPIISTNSGWDVYNKEKNQWNPAVGNGGFSLRKISTFKELTDPNGEFRTYYNITDELIDKVVYEDKYFCNDIIKLYELNIPNWLIASKFAFDMNADLYSFIFKLDHLPMCVHAWPKTIRFWKDKIQELIDNPSIVDFCEDKFKDYFKIYYNKNNHTIQETDDNQEEQK